MIDRNALLHDLKRAVVAKVERRKALSAAEAAVATAGAGVRVSPAWKKMLAVKATAKRLQREYDRACASVEGVETEILTGMTGLELFDAASNGEVTPTLPSLMKGEGVLEGHAS